MIDRLTALCLAGSVLLAVALPFEFRSNLSTTAEPEPSPKSDAIPTVQKERAESSQLIATILARPLFSPTRRPAEAAATDHSETPLSDMRLTGILITPDQRLAIFAPAGGGKPLVRAEGDMISDWRIESIASQLVSLTGPTGATTLEPKADPNLVRVPGGQPVSQPAAPAANPQPTPAASRQPMPAANASVRPPPIPFRRSSR